MTQEIKYKQKITKVREKGKRSQEKKYLWSIWPNDLSYSIHIECVVYSYCINFN